MTLTASDVGHTIRVRETASNAAATSRPAGSPPTNVVSAPTPPPSHAAAANHAGARPASHAPDRVSRHR